MRYYAGEGMRRKGDPVRGNLGSPGGFARTSRRLVGEGVQTTRGSLMMTFAVDEGAWVRKNVVFALSCDAGARGRRWRLVYGVSLAFESGLIASATSGCFLLL